MNAMRKRCETSPRASPYVKGFADGKRLAMTVNNGGRDNTLRVKGELAPTMRTIVKKYGLRPEDLFDLAVPAIAVSVMGALMVLWVGSIQLMLIN
jgi:hypothetical protein